MKGHHSRSRKTIRPLRCGLIGAGRFGWGHHGQTLLQHPKFQLAAVCDLLPERVAAAVAASGCAGYARYEDLLADRRVELVVVATVSGLHERHVLQALKAGKHVLVEKPAALSAAGIDRMVRAARRSGTLLTVHHNRRLDPDLLLVREVIASGRLGRLFRVRRCLAGFSRRNDWQTLRKHGGGLMGNWGVHLVDQCLQLSPAPVRRVWGSVRHVWNPGDAEDDIKACVELKDGLVLDIEMTSACASVQPEWVVAGSTGTLSIQGGRARLLCFHPDHLPPMEAIDLPYYPAERPTPAASTAAIPWQDEEMPAEPRQKQPSFYDQLYAAVREGAPLLVTPESARRTYALMDRICAGE